MFFERIQNKLRTTCLLYFLCFISRYWKKKNQSRPIILLSNKYLIHISSIIIPIRRKKWKPEVVHDNEHYRCNAREIMPRNQFLHFKVKINVKFSYELTVFLKSYCRKYYGYYVNVISIILESLTRFQHRTLIWNILEALIKNKNVLSS